MMNWHLPDSIVELQLTDVSKESQNRTTVL